MDILNSLSQALYPGHRVIRVKGFQCAKDYPMPRDSEAIMLEKRRGLVMSPLSI